MLRFIETVVMVVVAVNPRIGPGKGRRVHEWHDRGRTIDLHAVFVCAGDRGNARPVRGRGKRCHNGFAFTAHDSIGSEFAERSLGCDRTVWTDGDSPAATSAQRV